MQIAVFPLGYGTISFVVNEHFIAFGFSQKRKTEVVAAEEVYELFFLGAIRCDNNAALAFAKKISILAEVFVGTDLKTNASNHSALHNPTPADTTHHTTT